jgi:hypothetical protein
MCEVTKEKFRPGAVANFGFNRAYGATIWCSAGRGVFIPTIIGNTVGWIIVVVGATAGTLNSMGWIAALIYLFGAAGSA